MSAGRGAAPQQFCKSTNSEHRSSEFALLTNSQIRNPSDVLMNMKFKNNNVKRSLLVLPYKSVQELRLNLILKCLHIVKSRKYHID
jgi:hypothetical protein